MIRFGVIVSVVVAAVGLLVVGAVAGELTLVYVSIALAAVALLLLIVGVAVWRDEVFSSSARRDERDLASVGAVGQAGWPAAGPGALEDWVERSAPAPRPGPTTGPGPGPQGGDAREFAVPAGALPDRDVPTHRDRRPGEPRPTEQRARPGDPAGRPGREVRPREQPGRDAAAADWPGRDAAPGERSAHEAEAADRAARETVSGHRDRAGRYPIVAGSERYESSDDPTRLAHRLDSLADFGRQPDPDPTSSARSPAGQRLPAPAPIDPLAGPADERRSPAEPVAASASPGRAAARPTRSEPGTGAGADTPPLPRTVPSATAPGTTTPATAKDLGSDGPVLPVESSHGWPGGAQDRTESAAADSPTVSLAWPRVPSGADARLPAEAAGPASPARLPAASDEGQAATARSATTPAPAVAVGTAAASQAGAVAAVGSPEPATAGTAAPEAGEAGAPAIGLDDQVSVVPGIARYHKADCILIRFLSDDDLELMSRREAEAGGCAPCRACRPDRPASD